MKERSADNNKKENNKKENNKKAGRRRTVTIIVAALAVIISGISFVMMLLRVPNMHIVFYLVLGLSTLLVMYLALWTLGAYERYARLAKALRRCYFICLAVGLAGFITMQFLIISGAQTDDAEVDCLIVLGAGLRNDVPSMVLRTRLNKAAGYLATREDIPVIVSGGLGSGETITEAEAMSLYLRTRGVDENLIWKEDTSRNTRENLTFSLALMEGNGLSIENTKVAIVTSEFHLYRAKLIAGKAGIDAVGIAAETPLFYMRALCYFREAFSLAKEFLF